MRFQNAGRSRTDRRYRIDHVQRGHEYAALGFVFRQVGNIECHPQRWTTLHDQLAGAVVATGRQCRPLWREIGSDTHDMFE